MLGRLGRTLSSVGEGRGGERRGGEGRGEEGRGGEDCEEGCGVGAYTAVAAHVARTIQSTQSSGTQNQMSHPPSK